MIMDFDFEEDEDRMEEDLMRKVRKFDGELIKTLKYVITLKLKSVALTLVTRSDRQERRELKRLKKKLREMRRRAKELLGACEWRGTELEAEKLIRELMETDNPLGATLARSVPNRVDLEREVSRLRLQVELTCSSYEDEETIF